MTKPIASILDRDGSTLSTLNSATTFTNNEGFVVSEQLAPGETWTGTWERNGFGQIGFRAYAEQGCNVFLDFANNRSSGVVSTKPFSGISIPSGEVSEYVGDKLAGWVRVRITNQNSEATNFEIYTYFGNDLAKDSNSLIIASTNRAETIYDTSSFGGLVTVQNTPFIQATATYDLIPANFREFTAFGGTTGTENRLFKVSTGTTQSGYGAIQSFRSVNSKVGQSTMGRFTGYFSSSAANSWQGIGFISIGDEASFGYNGTSFGVWHRYGGRAEARTITVSVAAGGAETLTLTLNSVAYSIPLTAGTTAHNAYEIAAWLNNSSNQSVWGADHVGSTVIISALSDGAKSGTYSFSSSGAATGSIVQNLAGVTKTSDFVSKEDWNGETITDLDPTKGNLYQIKYQNMGFGEIIYSIEDQESAQFKTVHTIKVSNTTTTRSFGNPSLRTGCYAASIGSTTNLDVYVDSFAAFVQGGVYKTRNPRSITNTQTLSDTNERTALVLRNSKTYNYYPNQIEIEPLKVTVASEINKNVIFRVRAIQNLLTPELAFSDVGTNLISDVSTTSAVFTAGRLLDSITVAPNDGDKINLQELKISIPPSLHLIITAQRTGGATGDVTCTLTWYEDL